MLSSRKAAFSAASMSRSFASIAAEYGIIFSPGRFSVSQACSLGRCLFFLRRKSFSDMFTR